MHGVIYPPQVALVGFGAIRERPWAADGMLGVRPIVRRDARRRPPRQRRARRGPLPRPRSTADYRSRRSYDTEQELRDVVISALTEVAPDIDPAAIDPDADLAEQLDIDSMDFLNIVVAINERTGIEIPERDYPKLSTLNDAVGYLSRAQAFVAGSGA